MSGQIKIPQYMHVAIGIIIAAGLLFAAYRFYQNEKLKEKQRIVFLNCMAHMRDIGEAETAFYIFNERAPKDISELNEFASSGNAIRYQDKSKIKSVKSACLLGLFNDDEYIIPQYNDPDAYKWEKSRPLVLCRYHKMAYVSNGGIEFVEKLDGSRLTNQEILDWLKTKLKPESIEAIRDVILDL